MRILGCFSRLKDGSFEIIAPSSDEYNCIVGPPGTRTTGGGLPLARSISGAMVCPMKRGPKPSSRRSEPGVCLLVILLAIGVTVTKRSLSTPRRDPYDAARSCRMRWSSKPPRWECIAHDLGRVGGRRPRRVRSNRSDIEKTSGVSSVPAPTIISRAHSSYPRMDTFEDSSGKRRQVPVRRSLGTVIRRLMRTVMSLSPHCPGGVRLRSMNGFLAHGNRLQSQGFARVPALRPGLELSILPGLERPSLPAIEPNMGPIPSRSTRLSCP